MDVAFLYESTDASVGWTHSLPWEADRLIDMKRCPATGKLVGMVCDGLVAAAVTTASTTDDSDDTTTNHRNPTESLDEGSVVRFRFGKKTYQLSTQGDKRQRKSEENDRQSGSGWLGWLGMSQRTAHTSSEGESTTFAQDRIAEALDLTNLKILHKGSVLYHSQGSETTTKYNTEQAAITSEALLKISREDWKSQQNKKKATLVVMGTPRAQQWKEPLRDATDGSTTPLKTLQQWVRLPFSFCWWTFKLFWHFVVSFGPSHTLGSSDDISGSNSDRPHTHED